jgi:16S rRNA (cytosine967-C5)-methyltransferase
MKCFFAFAAEGKIYFQEESSQLVGKTVDLQNNEAFLDVCAAPGSKFSQICAASKLKFQNSELKNKKPFAVAGDLYGHRLRFLRNSAQNQGLDKIDSVAYNAESELPFAAETFDCILLDAPCSGTGTIRHNPEIRYFLTESDFAELQAKQLAILQNASKALKPGGRIVYSTCSLEREENETVIERFLQSNPEFEKNSPRLPQDF